MKRVEKRKVRWLSSLLAIVFCIGFAFLAQAQQEYENSDEFEKSKQEFGKEKEDKPPVSIQLGEKERERDWTNRQRWGGWGGPMAGGLVLDLSALDPMTGDRDVSELNETFTVIGGMGGMAYQNPDSRGWWRFGGMGFGGDQSESDRVEGDTRRAGMSIGGGGLFIEYHYPIVSRLDVGLGGAVGGGSVTLSAEGEDLGILDEDGFIDDDGDWSESQSFWFGYPYAGLSLGITNWMRLEATAGYLYFDADLTGADFVIDDSDMEMTDGDLSGGAQYMVRVLFGFQLEREK